MNPGRLPVQASPGQGRAGRYSRLDWCVAWCSPEGKQYGYLLKQGTRCRMERQTVQLRYLDVEMKISPYHPVASPAVLSVSVMMAMAPISRGSWPNRRR